MQENIKEKSRKSKRGLKKNGRFIRIIELSENERKHNESSEFSIAREFEDTIHPIIEARLKIKEENYKLAHLRDTLLPTLMSGEIDVDNL